MSPQAKRLKETLTILGVDLFGSLSVTTETRRIKDASTGCYYTEYGSASAVTRQLTENEVLAIQAEHPCAKISNGKIAFIKA